MNVSYEVALQREMLKQARECSRLECALQDAIIALEIYALPGLDGWRRDEIVARIAKLKLAAEEQTQK